MSTAAASGSFEVGTASWVPATEPMPTDNATGSSRTPVDSGP